MEWWGGGGGGGGKGRGESMCKRKDNASIGHVKQHVNN